MIATKRQEELSRCYLNAVSAVKGIAMNINPHDDDGVDVTLQKEIKLQNGGKYSARIAIQLKSTSSVLSESETSFSYPLEKKNYDDLRKPATIKPFLFLLILPSDEQYWVHHSIDELVIRKCMYWTDLMGLPDSENKKTVSVQIPKRQTVSPDSLENLLSQIAEDEL